MSQWRKPMPKYKVVTTWVVEVADDEVQRATKGYGQNVDPKQLAVFKAVQKSIEVAMGEGQWEKGLSVYFDVTEITN
jgi:hypothetical protein